MSKNKAMNEAKGAKAAKADVLTKVKGSAVTKPAVTAKSKSKDVAKEVAKKVKKDDKKKKVVKEPTPEPESSSEEDEDVDSDDSEESEVEAPAPKSKANGVKAPQKQAKDESESDDDSSDESASEDEAPKPKANGVAKSIAKAAADSDSDSDSDSDDSTDAAKPSAAAANESDESDDSENDSDASDSDDSEEEEAKPKANGVKVGASSTEEDDSEDGSSDDSDDDDEEEEKKPAPAKRKADEDSPFAAKKAKVDAADTSKGPNLFVGNLSWNVDEAWLRSEFEEFGELSGVRLMTDRATGRSKGFGYVEFVEAADAAKAHEAKQGAELDGRTLNVDFANARQGGAEKQDNRRKSYGDQVGEPSETLFLGNLSFDADQDSLSEAFAPYGNIQSVRLPTDRETGAPKGFGYITFATQEEASAALTAMQGAYISNRPIRLDYSTPKPQTDSPSRGGFGGRGRGSFGGNRGRGGFGDRGRSAPRGRGRGGFASTNRGGFGDFSGKKTTF